MKKFINIMCLTLALSACQPEPLVIEGVPAADSKLVVSTVLGSDQLLTLFLTRSYGALDGNLEENNELINNYVVRNAEVSLKYGAQEVFLNEIEFGVYGTNDIQLDEGQEFELNIYDKRSNQTAQSKTIMQQVSRFEEIEMTLNTESIDTVIDVNYSFQDKLGESYYMINVQKASLNTTAEAIINNRVYTYLLNDQDYNDGDLIEGEFIALFRKISRGDTMMVSLSNISYDYYDYLERINNGFLGPSLITEPYNYPSNVLNGYGFFNLYYTDNRFKILNK